MQDCPHKTNQIACLALIRGKLALILHLHSFKVKTLRSFFSTKVEFELELSNL
jgi:hypothetical protein